MHVDDLGKALNLIGKGTYVESEYHEKQTPLHYCHARLLNSELENELIIQQKIKINWPLFILLVHVVILELFILLSFSKREITRINFTT